MMTKRYNLVVSLVLAMVAVTFPEHVKALDSIDDSQSLWPKAEQVAQNKANAGLKLLEKGSDKAARRAKSIFEEVSIAETSSEIFSNIIIFPTPSYCKQINYFVLESPLTSHS